MARVTITGRLLDGGGDAIPASQQPRLWAVPEKAVISEGEAITNDEVAASLQTDGRFSVQVDNAAGLRWSLWVDRLPPGQETEPPEKRARHWVQWTRWFYPGAGGDLGDTLPIDHPTMLWIGPTAPPVNEDGTWDDGLRWLNSNPSSSEYGWIRRWEA